MKRIVLILALILLTGTSWSQSILVFQTDFGSKDAAVAAMKGVAVGVAPDLRIYDVTHEIPAFNVWEAALRLGQTAEYWPVGTVFVSVVDPGVGTDRKSVVLQTESGHYFVTPDNGTLTFVAEQLRIKAVREIDEAVNRRPNSDESHTFHGRDVYAYTGARLAAGVISFEEVGRQLAPEVISLPYQKARFADGSLHGNIPILDAQFGNIWTNIDREIFSRLDLNFGEIATVEIRHADELIQRMRILYVATFGDVDQGESLLYINSLNNASLAINQGSFAAKYGISAGHEWSIRISK